MATTAPMHAVVVADRRATSELAAVLPDACPALLPISGKAVIEYTLEELADVGLCEVILIASEHADRLRALVGTGERWGLRISITHSRGDEAVAALLARLGTRITSPCLVLRGDELRSRALDEFLASCYRRPGEDLAGADAHGRVVMYRLTGVGGAGPGASGSGSAAVTLADLQLSHLDSATAFHHANRDVLAGLYPGLLRAGIPDGARLRRGRLCRVAAGQVETGPAYVGDHAEVHGSVRMAGFVIVGADCCIDRDTHLENCIVMPGTYVGAGLTLRDAIVSRCGIYHLRRGRLLTVPDSLWIGAIEHGPLPGHTGLGERALALMLLLLSLPAWPIAALCAVLVHPGRAVEPLALNSNRTTPAGDQGTFRSWRFRAGLTMLRNLPRLLDVMRGHLRLIGAAAGPARAAGIASLPPGAGAPAAGLISAARLRLPPGAPPEEIWLTELLLSRESLTNRVKALLGALLKLRVRARVAP